MDLKKLKENLTEKDEQLIRMFDALGDESRYRIFKLLMQDKKICVSELAEILKISVSAVSQQLRILEMRKLVNHERNGQMMCYQVRQNDEFVKCILGLI
ncbi:MAG: metalloregulator ArsR/SmtB family transcription factor [bacterium]|nr:metalloregulator ArsR/SmtB family transcription factor [bacterium]